LLTALFEDGDVPGERMFSFHSKQNKRHITNKKNSTSQHSENHQYHNKDEQKVFNICPQGKLLH